jgi:hypothetical protein
LLLDEVEFELPPLEEPPPELGVVSVGAVVVVGV